MFELLKRNLNLTESNIQSSVDRVVSGILSMKEALFFDTFLSTIYRLVVDYLAPVCRGGLAHQRLRIKEHLKIN